VRYRGSKVRTMVLARAFLAMERPAATPKIILRAVGIAATSPILGGRERYRLMSSRARRSPGSIQHHRTEAILSQGAATANRDIKLSSPESDTRNSRRKNRIAWTLALVAALGPGMSSESMTVH